MEWSKCRMRSFSQFSAQITSKIGHRWIDRIKTVLSLYMELLPVSFFGKFIPYNQKNTMHWLNVSGDCLIPSFFCVLQFAIGQIRTHALDFKLNLFSLHVRLIGLLSLEIHQNTELLFPKLFLFKTFSLDFSTFSKNEATVEEIGIKFFLASTQINTIWTASS